MTVRPLFLLLTALFLGSQTTLAGQWTEPRTAATGGQDTGIPMLLHSTPAPHQATGPWYLSNDATRFVVELDQNSSQPVVPQQPSDNTGNRDYAGQSVTTDNLTDQAGRDTAAAIISGSRRPGIIEHQIIRTNRGDKPEVNISYPSVGQKAIDIDIRQWASSIADAFDDSVTSTTMLLSSPRPNPELWGAYSITHPSDNALSITFEIWTYTGGAHGNLDIITLNYSLLNCQRLGLVDIFEDPEAAVAIMSAWSYNVLSQRLGGMRQEQILRDGLATVPENFASLTLIPDGIRINFQPYQVATGDAGAQKVDIPLEELQPAHPLLVLWGK